MRRLLVVATLLPVLLASQGTPARADNFGGPPAAPPSTGETQREETSTSPTRTCRMYANPSGFGALCSDAVVGRTLAEILRDVGIDPTRPFCWDDADLPEGFVPDRPGRWFLYTCLSFTDGIVSRGTAQVTYEFQPRESGTERLLTPGEAEAIARVLGRGRLPFLQVQTSPVSSPRVEQDVAFSLLCDPRVTCDAGGGVRTPAVAVGEGLRMWAELVHTRVLPEGTPEVVLDCLGAGLARTAEQLDGAPAGDPRVCRHRYARSSAEAGGGQSGDRYPAEVTAYWQVWFDNGEGAQRLGLSYEKTTVNAIRVTEVQTLVVS